MELARIKAIVFDLDGTLYEDTHHFDYYAERLKEKLPFDVQAIFMEDYELALDYYHPLRVGRVYDAKRDLILIQVDGRVSHAFHWDGTALSPKKIKEIYPEPIAINLENMFNIGDLWWVPSAIARHYGLDDASVREAFLETRAYMMSDAFNMKPILGFKETLERIREKVTLILLTNSPEPDSEAILTKLGLHDVFHEKIFNARKPVLTEQHFQKIAEKYGVSMNEILSIGDNYLNDILPARKLGCATIFIDEHEVGDENIADLVVSEIFEILPVLRKIAKEKG